MSIGIARLREAGRSPELPFELDLGAGERLEFRRLLRLLPGKRLVGEAEWQGRTVLAKLFISTAGKRHARREQEGIEALLRAGIPTPLLLATRAMHDGGMAILSEFLPGANSLAERWSAAESGGEQAQLACLQPALQLLARMHAAGLVQDDLHLGNFLEYDGRWFVIDGDAVRTVAPMPVTVAHDNLALLLAQLLPCWDAYLPAMAAMYGENVDLHALAASVRRQRAGRLAHFLGKTLRDCSQFAVQRDVRRVQSVLREAQPQLSALLNDPDAAIAAGALLKNGNTCTVAGHGDVVIKRYNLKNWRHALSRAWRPSRAWHAWREAHRLQFFGIATPTPLAMLEERIGPLRRRAFLFCEYCPGQNLLTLLSADSAPPQEIADAVVRLFEALCALRITHGDLKASNLLWHEGRIVVIDLDAMVQHRSPAAFARAWRRDRARLLRNWPSASMLHGWLDRHLPPA